MREHWQAACLKQCLGSFPDSSREPMYLSAIATGNAAKQIIPHTSHSQPQTFSHTLLQVTDNGISSPEVMDRLSSVPLWEAVAHTLGFTIQDIEGQLKDIILPVERQQLLRETLCFHHSVRDQLCPH